LSGGDFVFHEQIETLTEDAGTLCRSIADLVLKSDADPTTTVNAAINSGFGGQLSPPNNVPVLAKLGVKLAFRPVLDVGLNSSPQRKPMP
jgi:hypothetical protein